MRLIRATPSMGNAFPRYEGTGYLSNGAFRVRSFWSRVGSSLLIAALAIAPALSAQATDTVPTGTRRTMVTRAELQAALDEIQRGSTGSTAYSPQLRSAKQKDAQAIRVRLEEGDFRVGDEIKV